MRVANRVQTSQKGEWKPAEIDAVIRFSGDLKSFVWDAKTYHSPQAQPAEKKEEGEKKAEGEKKPESEKKVEGEKKERKDDKKEKKGSRGEKKDKK